MAHVVMVMAMAHVVMVMVMAHVVMVMAMAHVVMVMAMAHVVWIFAFPLLFQRHYYNSTFIFLGVISWWSDVNDK